MAKREEYFQHVLGHPLNPASKTQMQQLFYEGLRQQKIYGKAKPGVPPTLTCGKEALKLLGQREPILRPLLKAIAEYRSCGTFLKNFVLAALDVERGKAQQALQNLINRYDYSEHGGAPLLGIDADVELPDERAADADQATTDLEPAEPEVADDDEASTLDRLREKAGITWE